MNRDTLIKMAVGYAFVLLVVWGVLVVFTGVPFRHGEPFGMRFVAFWPFFIASGAGLLGLFIQVALGVFVYRDAKERGMEPVLWALVAALVPYFVGFVVYLVVRQTRQVTCPACGVRSREAPFCPHCGERLQSVCRSCGRPNRNGGKFCPHCGAPWEPAERAARS